MKKSGIVILWIIGVLIAVVALVLIIAPPVAKNYVNKHGQELIGRSVSVGKLRVSPLAGRLRICDFRVYEDDDTSVFVGFDTLFVKMNVLRLLSKEIHINGLSLSGLGASVVQNGKTFNFTSIIDFFKSKQDTTKVKPRNDTSQSSWAYSINNISLTDWKLIYSDLQRNSKWNLQDIDIVIPGIYLSGERDTGAGIDLSFSGGGRLSTKLDYNIASDDFTLKLILDKLALSNTRAYLADLVDISAIGGDLNLDLDLSGNLSELMNTSIKGSASVNGLSLTDKAGDEILSVRNFSVGAEDINLDSSLFLLSSISLDGLKAHYDQYDGYSNLSRLISKQKATSDSLSVESSQKADSLSTTPAPQFRLGSFSVTESAITYNDYSMTDRFSLPVTGIEVKAEDVMSGGLNKARINATVAEGGKLAVIWSGTIDNLKENQHLILNLKDFHLSEISPYSVEYLGQPFTGGVLSFTSDNTILNSDLNGKNSLKLVKPEVGARRADVDSARRLPLKAALYILKDINGEVNIDAPVSGNISSPEFSYMKIVWKTLKNLVVKIAASPFLAVGQALGFDAEKLDYMDVDPFQTSLSADQCAFLDKIAEMALYNGGGIDVSLTQEISETSEERVITLAQNRNEEVKAYLVAKGVSEDKLAVTTKTLTQEDQSKAGYRIGSALKD